MLYTSLIVLLGIALLILVINLPVHVALKFGIGVAAMYGVSKLLGSRMKIKDDWGMLLVRSKAGLKTIEKLAAHESAWKLFADVGLAIAYGAAAFFIIKRPLAERAAVLFAGLVSLTVIAFLVAPFVFPFLIGTVSVDGMVSKSASQQYANVTAGLMYIGGFALMVFVSLIAYAGMVVSAIIGSTFYGTGEAEKIAPGATLILPGVNIPFAEGIIALAIILLVHEGAHAVLSRVARVRILSSGIVLFGVLPIGAFVEPDEDELKKRDAEKQTRVLVAGSAANLFTSMIMFFVLLAFLFATVQYKESGLLIVNGNYSGNIIYKVNGVEAAEFFKTADNETKYNRTLAVESSAGAYELKISKEELRYYNLSEQFFVARYANPALNFIYNLLGLIFSLNFVIGIVNLLPLPFFDGYRLLEINVDKKIVVNVISWVAALAFLVNFLPWIF